MIKRILFSSFALTFLAAFALETPAQRKKGNRNRQGNLKPGDAAPQFTVKNMDGKKTVRLSDLKGKPVVLFFGSCT